MRTIVISKKAKEKAGLRRDLGSDFCVFQTQIKYRYKIRYWSQNGKTTEKKTGVYILATFPTLKGGGENRHFWKSGEENRPQRKKNLIVKKKNWILQANVFFYYKCNFIKKYIKESSFWLREAKL